MDFGDTESNTLLVCIGGITASAHSFLALGDYVGKYARIIAISLAGRGGSDRLTHYSQYWTDTYIADVNSVLASVCSNKSKQFKIILYGHSHSASVVLKYSSLLNNPINGIILGDVGAEIDSQYGHKMSKIMSATTSEFSESVVHKFMEYLKNKKLPPNSRASYLDMYKNVMFKYNQDKQAYSLTFDHIQIFKMLTEQQPLGTVASYWDNWDLIHVPVLILHCENSETLRSNTLDRMLLKTDIPIVYHKIPQCGHCLFDYDEQLSDVIISFISK